MQSKLPMHLSQSVARAQEAGAQSPAMPNGRCRMHGRRSPGAPKGNGNAFKHVRYTYRGDCSRHERAALIRATRAPACATEEAS